MAAPSRGTVERRSQRARRTRATSICSTAIRHAIEKRSVPAAGPAMARVRAAISFANAGSRQAGRLKPCRSALLAELALPAGVFGPRLARPLVRLALRLASLIMPAAVIYSYSLLLRIEFYCSCFILAQ